MLLESQLWKTSTKSECSEKDYADLIVSRILKVVIYSAIRISPISDIQVSLNAPTGRAFKGVPACNCITM